MLCCQAFFPKGALNGKRIWSFLVPFFLLPSLARQPFRYLLGYNGAFDAIYQKDGRSSFS